MKVIEYRTATGENCVSLDAEVGKLLAQGFQPYGNPYFSQSKGKGAATTFQVGQAMIRNGLLDDPAPQVTLPATVLAP
jgi:hypothetical protein